MTRPSFIKYLISFIESNNKFNKIFNHHKQIYLLEDLFDALLFKLETGISYNMMTQLKHKIKGSTLYYFN